jgi:hypothetical protein
MPVDALATLSALRSLAGAGSWANPGLSWRTFGLGPIQGTQSSTTAASSALATRLFGVRDLALGLAVRHPDPSLRRVALQIGVAVDSADVIASVLAVRAGAPKATLVGVSLGAAAFIALGIAALTHQSQQEGPHE